MGKGFGRPHVVFLFLAFVLASQAIAGERLLGKKDALTTPSQAELQAPDYLRNDYIRLEVAFDGLYRVYGRDLIAAGVPVDVGPEKFALWNFSQLVPIYVHAQDPGRLTPDDYIEFIGEPPPGTYSTYMPDNYYNVYFLTWNSPQSLHYKTRKLTNPSVPSSDLSYWHFYHLEEDNYYRESQLPRGITDNFYWCHMAAGDNRTFPIRIDFPDLDQRFVKTIPLVLRIFGYSDVPGVVPKHKFRVLYGDSDSPSAKRYDLGTFEFDYRGYYDFHTSLPVEKVGFRQRILFETPSDRANVIDVVSFDWIRAWYPRKLDAGKRNWFVFNSNLCVDPKPPYSFAVRNVRPGSRVFCPSQATIYEAAGNMVVVHADNRETTYSLVTEDAILTVNSIEYRHPSTLPKAFTTGVESLLLFDPELTDAVVRYVQYRETTGPRTVAIDVTDIFDATNVGFKSDIAIKRFIRYAAAHSPSLRYLVMFGDSTQDYRLALTENYDEPDPPRVGVPIHWIENPATIRTGGYVDDNWYASFKSANTPDLATGRIPAANLVQANEYVRKLIEYETYEAAREDGMLVVSSVEARFQDMAAAVQNQFRDCFTTISLLFPETAVATREVERLREAINRGLQVFYYIGHGGAFVWRVGPVDYSLQKDLFTPRDVAQLRNALHYPIILASSCYTTAFDTQFSIGEAFIFQPRGGAIAIIGSPWKSSAYEDHSFNVRFLENYCKAASLGFHRLGEVYQRTKDAQRPRDDSYVDVQTFTMLGDPTLKLVSRR